MIYTLVAIVFLSAGDFREIKLAERLTFSQCLSRSFQEFASPRWRGLALGMRCEPNKGIVI